MILIVGTVGRESGQVRLRVIVTTTGEFCVLMFTNADAHLYTDEHTGYNHIVRAHATVCHSANEWARDDDGDGIREVHVNTFEPLRPSREDDFKKDRGKVRFSPVSAVSRTRSIHDDYRIGFALMRCRSCLRLSHPNGKTLGIGK